MDGFVGDRVKLLVDNLWPALLPGDAQLDAYKLQKVLADSQWLERSETEDYQLEHLKNLVKFAAREVPFYRSRIARDLLDDASTLDDALARLPIVSREQLRDAGDALRPETLPKGEVPAGTTTSTDSSGVTVQVATTELGLRWRRILDLRRLLWAGVDFDRSIAVIQTTAAGVAEYPSGLRYERWKDASDIPFRTGPSFHLSARASLDEQSEWLKRIAPTYLYTSTSLIREHGTIALEGELALDTILTRGDIVDAGLRALVSRKF
jgi:phenylacetate-coenzyme A ligase PaaK-like adenylate-forming protein